MASKKRNLLGVFLAFVLVAGAVGGAIGAEQEPYVPMTTRGIDDFLTRTVAPDCDAIEGLLDCSTSGRQADIVFVFDTTSSMVNEISSMINAAKAFASALAASGIDYRLGLTEYKDFPGSPCGASADFPYEIYNGGTLTSSVGTFNSWVSGLKATGGGDYPESLLAALSHTVTDQSWRATARKIAIVITDDEPHSDGDSCNKEGNTINGVIGKLVSNGVVTHVVGPNKSSVKKIANDTDGKWFEIRSTGTDITPIISTIADIIGCSFDINLTTSCAGGTLSVQGQLIGPGGVLPRSSYPGLFSVNATAAKSGGGTVSIPITWSGNTFNGSISGASGSYKVGVTAKVCDWSSSTSVTVKCDEGGGTDCDDCPDSDNDGVIDPWDLCPATPPCSGVDRHGCRICGIGTGDCIIKIIKPEDGDLITTTLTLAATACPTPAKVKFIAKWPGPFGGTQSTSWIDSNAADGWGLFNIPVSDLTLDPLEVMAQALGTDNSVLCETGWVTFSIDTL